MILFTDGQANDVDGCKGLLSTLPSNATVCIVCVGGVIESEHVQKYESVRNTRTFNSGGDLFKSLTEWIGMRSGQI
jgi:methylmalonyl-CoA mutase cobalamin-binding subunit